MALRGVIYIHTHTSRALSIAGIPNRDMAASTEVEIRHGSSKNEFHLGRSAFSIWREERHLDSQG